MQVLFAQRDKELLAKVCGYKENETKWFCFFDLFTITEKRVVKIPNVKTTYSPRNTPKPALPAPTKSVAAPVKLAQPEAPKNQLSTPTGLFLFSSTWITVVVAPQVAPAPKAATKQQVVEKPKEDEWTVVKSKKKSGIPQGNYNKQKKNNAPGTLY